MPLAVSSHGDSERHHNELDSELLGPHWHSAHSTVTSYVYESESPGSEESSGPGLWTLAMDGSCFPPNLTRNGGVDPSQRCCGWRFNNLNVRALASHSGIAC